MRDRNRRLWSQSARVCADVNRLIDAKSTRHLVRDKQNRGFSAQCVCRSSEGLRSVGIQRRRRLIKDQHPQLSQQGARDGNSLTLSAPRTDAVL
jgi:hypothetical protein